MSKKAIYEVTVTLTEPMLGTVPKNQEVYRRYIESKKPADVEDEEFTTVEEIEEAGWTGFHSDENGLFVYDYFVRGFIKESCRVAALFPAPVTKVDRYLFVFPRRIYLLDGNGRVKKQPDGVLERPLRAMTMRGPRVTVARSDYVNAGTVLKFEIHNLNPQIFTRQVLDDLLAYGEYQGLGQWRNASYGRFEYKMVLRREEGGEEEDEGKKSKRRT